MGEKANSFYYTSIDNNGILVRVIDAGSGNFNHIHFPVFNCLPDGD